MRLGYFTMPVHPMQREWAQTLKEDRQAIMLADKLGFHDAFMGEHLTDACENITNSMIFLASLFPETKRSSLPPAPAIFRTCIRSDRRAGGDVRSSLGRPLHLRREPRRAHLGCRSARHSR